MNETRRSDLGAVLAVGIPQSPYHPPTVIIGLPDTLWRTMTSGQTLDFDLRHAGVYANLVIVRGENGADIAAILHTAQANLDKAPGVGAGSAKQTKQ